MLHFTLGIKQHDILESITKLENLNKKINSSNLTDSNPSLDLAEWITCIPVIYYPFGLQSASIRFKNSLQENCKIHVIAEDVIEACHNGVVAWDSKSNFQAIWIRGRDDYEKTIQYWNILKKLFDESKINYKEIMSEQGNILTKLICLIYLLDFSSIYLSVKLGKNPTPVDAIDYIKNSLKRI